MTSILASPVRSLLAGLAVSVVLLAAWIGAAPVDAQGLVSMLLRFVHVFAAMAWIGLVVFVNFVQLPALKQADETGRSAILKWIVPSVATGIRHASHLVVLTGVLLLVASGYLFGSWVFASAVYVSSPRAAMLAAGTAGAILMWSLLHFVIAPNLRIVLGETASDPAAQAAARETVGRYARLNLLLALPVTLAMVAAAHL